MRKLVIGMALASTAIATPAFARDDAWYVELDFGAMIVEDADATINGVDNEGQFNFKTGYDGGATIGYDFGGFRLETEASYRESSVDSYTDSAGYASNLGDANALSFMVNGLLDFGPDDGLQGYVGGGAGVARVSYDLVDDSDTGFAWQVIAGLRAPLSKHVDIGLKYRFFNADSIDLVTTAGDSLSTKWRSHSLMGTLSYNFGEEAAPPPSAPSPPSPPPPSPRTRPTRCRARPSRAITPPPRPRAAWCSSSTTGMASTITSASAPT